MRRKAWWGFSVLIGIGLTFTLSGCSSHSSIKGDGEFIDIGNKDVASIQKNKETMFVYGYAKTPIDDPEPFERRMKTVMKNMGVNIYRYQTIYWSREKGKIVYGDSGKKVTGNKLKATKLIPYDEAVYFFYNGKRVGNFDVSHYNHINEDYQKFQKNFKAFLKDMIENYTE